MKKKSVAKIRMTTGSWVGTAFSVLGEDDEFFEIKDGIFVRKTRCEIIKYHGE